MPYSAANQKHTHYQGVLTTDATVTTIKTIPVKNLSVVCVEAKIVGVRTGGTAGGTGDSASYHLEHSAVNAAGTAVELGTMSTIRGAENQAGWSATITVDSGNVLVRVTGAANNNITWMAEIKVLENN